jgi:hypothetical protein
MDNNISMKKIALAMFMLSVLFVVTSCSDNKSAQNEDVYQNPNQTNESEETKNEDLQQNSTIDNSQDRGFETPLFKYMSSNQDYDIILAAQNLIATKCMAAKGFTKQEKSSKPEDKSRSVGDDDLGIIDIDIVKKWGYATFLEGGQVYFDENGVMQMTDEFREEHMVDVEQNQSEAKAYMENGGCSDQGKDRFYNGVNLPLDKSYDEKISKLEKKTKENVVAFQETQQVLQKYKACIHQAGYEIDLPPMTVFDHGFPEKYANPSKGDDNNRKLATADVTCKNTSGLVDYWHKTITDEENKVIQEDLPMFQEQQQYLDTLVNHANLIISTNAEGYFD